jgi:hypothetical protein
MGCWSVGASKVWVDGVAIPSQPVSSAIQSSHQNATGALHDCSNLSLESASLCQGAKGKMCLVHFENKSAEDTIFNAEPWQVSDNAEESGCVGVIAFDQTYYGPQWHGLSELLIPYLYIKEEEGLVLLDSKIGKDAKVEVDIFGAACLWGVVSGTGTEFATQTCPAMTIAFALLKGVALALICTVKAGVWRAQKIRQIVILKLGYWFNLVMMIIMVVGINHIPIRSRMWKVAPRHVTQEQH